MSPPKPNPPPLADAHDRQRAERELETSFAVEAAAGAGKTTVLVSRLLELVGSSRAALDEIVAITFTERAAGELKMRVRERIEGELAGDIDDARRARLRQALDDLGHASIGTIHGFCASLLRERPVEAGVDPQFSVADELAASLLRERTWENWLEAELAAGSQALLRAVAHGISLEDPDRGLYELALRMLRCRDLLGGCPPRPGGGASVRQFLAFARPKLASLVDQLDTYCGGTTCEPFRAKMEEARRTVVLADGLGDAQAEAQAMRLDLKGRFPGTKHWSRQPSRDLAKELHEALKARLGELQEAIGHDLTAATAEALCGFVHAYRAAKEAEGLLDFDDLLLVARDMLARSRSARDHFKASFRFLLVDEFQDTDPLQVEIVFFLAERRDRHAQRWDAVELEPGKLFVVGDPKQSIYRFRRADIEIYEKAKAALSRQGDTLVLSQSFRPLEGVAETVNHLFAELIRKPPDGAYQPDYVPLHPFRGRGPRRPASYLLYPPPDLVDELKGQDDYRRAEARCVAAMVRRIVEEQWAVFDKAEGRERPVSYGDIAVLARTFTASDIYADELAAADIPLRIVGGRHFYLASEIHSLVAVLKAIDNPHDGLSLVGALRGPFFGISDDALLLAACERGRLNYLEGDYGGAVAQAMAVLREFHERRNDEPLALLLQRLLERTKALELAALRPRGEQRVANLLKIVERARELEAAERVSYRGFVRWLSRLHDTEADETESPLLEAGRDLVQFLTIHRSKGLEFPVVFVADMTSGMRRTSSFVILRDREPGEGQFAFYLGRKDQGICTANWPGDDYDRVRAQAEAARLFYVATTRARDLLFLMPGWGERDAGFTAFLPERLRGDDPPWGEATEIGHVLATASLGLGEGAPAAFRVRLPGGEGMTRAAEKRLAARQRWQHDVGEQLQQAQAGVVWRRPSHLEEGMLSMPEEAPGGVGGEGRQVGSVVHRCLERAGVAEPGAVEALLAAEAREADLSTAAADRARRLLRVALESPLVARARAAEACYHEVPFSLEVQGTVLTGSMDLLFVEDGGAVVVDFKTDAVRDPQELARRAQAYQPQVEAYALAASRVLCKPVKEVILFFLSAEREWPIPVTEAMLGAAAARIASDE